MVLSNLNKICHWGPITVLGIIKMVTATTVHCTNMWWPTTTTLGTLNFAFFMILACLTLYNFLSSIFHGPGYLPLEWKPIVDSNCKYLQYCCECEGYKAPRSHHCRRCKRCILKMDHHCPWINNCVGWGNHAHFIAFLSFAVLGCFHAGLILSFTIYKTYLKNSQLRNNISSNIRLSVWEFVFSVTALGFCIGVVISVGLLLYFQLKSVIKNRTGIEEWIVEKAIHNRQNSNEPFVYPYDIGILNNIGQVLNFSCQPIGDGINWPVIQGCNPYTLTKEQLQQKLLKRHRSKLYKIIRSASGSWFPLTQGVYVLFCPPCTDEPRIPLSIGDKVMVSRWRKHWLFGEKIQTSDLRHPLPRIRGWFPKRCTDGFPIDSSDLKMKIQ